MSYLPSHQLSFTQLSRVVGLGFSQSKKCLALPFSRSFRSSGSGTHTFSFDFPSFSDGIKATIEQHMKSNPLLQSKYPIRSVRSLVQHHAPDAVYEDNSIKKLTLSSYKGQYYVLLFFYPLDFTFVCPTEIVAFNSKISEFKKRGVEVVGVSIDSPFCHHAWKSLPRSKGGIGNIKFPLVADLSKDISRNYGVLTEEGTVALRGLFLIDKEGVVRHSVVNDLPLGRSVDEAVRIIDALQHYEKHGEVCPANWEKGQPGLKPSTEGVSEYLSAIEDV